MLYCDGASRGNPGQSGIGVVLELDGGTCELSEPIGIATNNVAEYTALIRGLQKAISLGAEELSVYLDSELIVRQLNGRYRVKNETLKQLHGKATRLSESFKKLSVKHIPRRQNMKADSLAKKATAPPLFGHATTVQIQKRKP